MMQARNYRARFPRPRYPCRTVQGAENLSAFAKNYRPPHKKSKRLYTKAHAIETVNVWRIGELPPICLKAQTRIPHNHVSAIDAA